MAKADICRKEDKDWIVQQCVPLAKKALENEAIEKPPEKNTWHVKEQSTNFIKIVRQEAELPL